MREVAKRFHISDVGLKKVCVGGCADRIDPLKDAPSVLDTPEADMRLISLWQFEYDEE